MPQPISDAAYSQVIDGLSEFDGSPTSALSKRTGVPKAQAKRALLTAERLGHVTRTGRGRGTKWWLG